MGTKKKQQAAPEVARSRAKKARPTDAAGVFEVFVGSPRNGVVPQQRFSMDMQATIASGSWQVWLSDPAQKTDVIMESITRMRDDFMMEMLEWQAAHGKPEDMSAGAAESLRAYVRHKAELAQAPLPGPRLSWREFDELRRGVWVACATHWSVPSVPALVLRRVVGALDELTATFSETFTTFETAVEVKTHSAYYKRHRLADSFDELQRHKNDFDGTVEELRERLNAAERAVISHDRKVPGMLTVGRRRSTGPEFGIAKKLIHFAEPFGVLNESAHERFGHKPGALLAMLAAIDSVFVHNGPKSLSAYFEDPVKTAKAWSKEVRRYREQQQVGAQRRTRSG